MGQAAKIRLRNAARQSAQDGYVRVLNGQTGEWEAEPLRDEPAERREERPRPVRAARHFTD